MAKNSGNILLNKFSGNLGDSVYLKNYGGRQYMIRCPNREGHKKTEAEEANQHRFKLAQMYGSQVTKNPEAKAFYTPYREGVMTEYLLAQADKMISPVIKYIDSSDYCGLAGQQILIMATDNIKVTEVTCTIIGPTGVEIEKGNATPTVRDEEWSYIISNDHKMEEGTMIVVNAFDRPGNKAEAMLIIESAPHE